MSFLGKLVKVALGLLVLLVLPGAALGFFWWRYFSAIKTGDDNLDRLGIRGWIAFWVLVYFGPNRLDVAQALMAITHQESDGKPSNFLGDATLGGGPSDGPDQVYRKTAKELGLWKPSRDDMTAEEERAEYAQLAGKTWLGIKWGVQVFKDKLRQSGGDLPDAIHRYNGLGADSSVYEEPVLAYAKEHLSADLGAAS